MTAGAPPRRPDPFRTDVPVVVLKLVADAWQHGGLGIIRSLGRVGVPVHAAVREADAPSLRSRYLAGRFVTPSPDLGDEAVLARLLEVGERVGSRPVLIPTDDVAALFVDAQAERLGQAFRFPRQPAGLPHRLADKGELHRLCGEVGTPSPEARFPRSREELLEHAAELGYPVVLKSMDPVLLRQRANATSVAIAADAATAIARYDRMEDPDRPNLMLQEFIPGDARSVWMFNGYFDATGTCRMGAVGQKIRQAPPNTGATTLGEVVRGDEVAALAAHFLQAVGYRGIVDLGFRFDARDGRYKLLDVNPRIGSSFRLFVAANGMDVARALYLDLTEQEIPAAAVTEGRRWWVENQDAATCVRMLSGGDLSPLGLVRSFRGVREAAWLARDDIAPAAALAVAMLGAGIRRIGRSMRS